MNQLQIPAHLRNAKFVFIAGPGGVGKDSISEHVRELTDGLLTYTHVTTSNAITQLSKHRNGPRANLLQKIEDFRKNSPRTALIPTAFVAQALNYALQDTPEDCQIVSVVGWCRDKEQCKDIRAHSDLKPANSYLFWLQGSLEIIQARTAYRRSKSGDNPRPDDEPSAVEERYKIYVRSTLPPLKRTATLMRNNTLAPGRVSEVDSKELSMHDQLHLWIDQRDLLSPEIRSTILRRLNDSSNPAAIRVA